MHHVNRDRREKRGQKTKKMIEVEQREGKLESA